MSDLDDDGLGDIKDLDSSSDDDDQKLNQPRNTSSSASSTSTAAEPTATTAASEPAEPEGPMPNEIKQKSLVAAENDPLNRVYSDSVVTPRGMSMICGMLIRELAIHQPSKRNRPAFFRDFFDQLKDAREADPTMDLDRFLNTQAKIFQARVRVPLPRSWVEPPDVSEILTDFVMEAMRYEPADLFVFAYSYFYAVSEGQLQSFLEGEAAKKEDQYKKKWPDVAEQANDAPTNASADSSSD